MKALSMFVVMIFVVMMFVVTMFAVMMFVVTMFAVVMTGREVEIHGNASLLLPWR